jgi:hypothetical protein
MAAAWIQVFILTFAECVAPAGKTVCQEQQFELQFVNQADCEYALSQLIAMKDEFDHIIVNHQKSGCVPSAAQSEVYESLAAINEAHKDSANWRMTSENDVPGVRVDKKHEERLKTLMSCEETANVAPCKIGDIIVENEIDNSVEVWKGD